MFALAVTPAVASTSQTAITSETQLQNETYESADYLGERFDESADELQNESAENIRIHQSESKKELKGGVISTVVRIILYSKRLKFILKNGDELFFDQEDPDKAGEALKEYYLDKGTFDKGDIRDRGEGLPKSSAIIRFYDLPNSSEEVHLAYGDVSMGMLHIVTRHFPEYWSTFSVYPKAKISFFNPGTEFSYVEDVIESVIDYSFNGKEMAKNIKNLKVVPYDGYHEGEIYRVIMSGDRVVSVFPISYNQAD